MTDKDMMKDAARGIAKEVVSGVRSLGEYGYQSLSNYFNQQEPSPSSSLDMAFQQQQHRRAATTGSISSGSFDGASSSSSTQQRSLPSGMVSPMYIQSR